MEEFIEVMKGECMFSCFEGIDLFVYNFIIVLVDFLRVGLDLDFFKMI